MSGSVLTFDDFVRRVGAEDSRVSPHNLEAERSVLGAILLNNDAFNLASEVLKSSDFFRVAHSRIFYKMVKLVERNSVIDLVTLKDELNRSGELDGVGGPAYIAALVDAVPKSTNVMAYARLVKEKAALRTLILLGNKTIAAAYDQTEAATSIADAAQRDLSLVLDAVSLDAVAYSDDLAMFLNAAPSATAPLIEGLIPGAGLVLPHGQPRSRKSYVFLDALLSLAAGVSPMGLGRLAVAEPTPCWYLTEEDHQAEVARRIRALLAGRKAELPPLFRVSVRKGITLNDPRCQDQIVREALLHKMRAIAFDPARAFSDAVDKGPADLTPLTRFLRRLMRETDAVIILPHHDTKPRNDGKPDDRPRAQRASGGGLFSIADAPIHVERVNEESSLLVPNMWKFSIDPPAIKVRFSVGDGWMRLQGEDVEANAVTELALHERLLTTLAEHPGISGSRLATTAKARKEDVYTALEQLAGAGKVDSVQAGRKTRWFLAGTTRD